MTHSAAMGRGKRRRSSIATDGREKKGEENGKSQGEKKDFGHIENGYSENRNGDEPELRQHACGCEGFNLSLPRG